MTVETEYRWVPPADGPQNDRSGTPPFPDPEGMRPPRWAGPGWELQVRTVTTTDWELTGKVDPGWLVPASTTGSDQ